MNKCISKSDSSNFRNNREIRQEAWSSKKLDFTLDKMYLTTDNNGLKNDCKVFSRITNSPVA